ncbi:hypothetical protein ACPUVO_15610 [Pseudocolwellia sp. HL-MZ19]|uniref:hypothetical protein n=1 Tax=Pseudocolwellia sp. HL-MZ19 TaxID=3400846 RepID=UPI003CFBB3B1
MARRSQFKGIAHNLVKWSLSRNNDYSGYWAVGQLYSLAIENKCQEVNFDILRNTITPETHLFFDLFSAQLNIISQITGENCIPLSWLKKANVIFKFDVEYQDKYHFFGSALGNPMTCSVELTSDFGKVYSYTDGCNIRHHDPKREYRRSAF